MFTFPKLPNAEDALEPNISAETLSTIVSLLGHSKMENVAQFAHLDDADRLAINDEIGELIETALEEVVIRCAKLTVKHYS